MIALRRKTREQARHERAVVLQHLGTPTAAAVAADIRTNQERAARLRAQAGSAGVNTGPATTHEQPVKDAQQTRYKHGGASMPAGVPASAEPHNVPVPGAAVERGGGHHAPILGVVTVAVAGGNGSPEPCAYCGIVGGHNGNCPVIS